MIVYTDLRPGNYVKTFDKGRKQLLKITLDDLFKMHHKSLEVFPIKIAGEWLDKFGFSFKISYTHFKIAPIYLIQEKEFWFLMKKDLRINEHPLLYIHQLQNLFYCFAGEELVLR
jgi:hypothetical protein